MKYKLSIFILYVIVYNGTIECPKNRPPALDLQSLTEVAAVDKLAKKESSLTPRLRTIEYNKLRGKIAQLGVRSNFNICDDIDGQRNLYIENFRQTAQHLIQFRRDHPQAIWSNDFLAEEANFAHGLKPAQLYNNLVFQFRSIVNDVRWIKQFLDDCDPQFVEQSDWRNLHFEFERLSKACINMKRQGQGRK